MARRRRGSGNPTIMDVARDRACGDIWVATEGDNAPARALYRALGGGWDPQLASGAVVAESE